MREARCRRRPRPDSGSRSTGAPSRATARDSRSWIASGLVWFSLRHRGLNASREIDRIRRNRLGNR